jgi:hypothetical protein
VNIEEYGTTISIRNKSYPLEKEFVDMISNAIDEDGKREDYVYPINTYYYSLFHNSDICIGRLTSYFDEKYKYVVQAMLFIDVCGTTLSESQYKRLKQQLNILEAELTKVREA